MSNEPIPPAAPAPKSSGNRTILIVVAAVVVLCCLCTVVSGGAAAFFMIYNAPQARVMPTLEFAQPVLTPEEDLTPTLEEETPEPTETLEPTETPEPEVTETPEPTETTAAPQTGGPGMGVSRDEMMSFFNAGGAIKWDDPIKVSGVEMLQGTHSWLCVNSDCAAVTLAGPKDDLLAVSLAVPLSSTDAGEKLTAITLLMTAVAKFTDKEGLDTIPGQLMSDMEGAMKANKSMDKTFENNGYMFVESYNPKTHIGALGISRIK